MAPEHSGSPPRPDPPPSRSTSAEAGWGGPAPSAEDLTSAAVEEVRREKFSWLSRRVLIESRNDQFAKYIYDIVRDERPRWIAAQKAAGVERTCPNFVIDRTELGSFTAVVVGDTGEGDRSQQAVAQAIVANSAATEFMVVLSDVVYPAGDVNQYVEKFYAPFAHYPATIYAVPGNHDWYDLLDGFMFNFCGTEPLGRTGHRPGSYPVAEWLARILWRRSSRPDRTQLVGRRGRRPPWNEGPPRAPQPGPYWLLETEHVALVAIDTGITGRIDHEQGEWLLRVSETVQKPKVLLTGKPLIVDSELRPCEIDWARGAGARPKTVDEVVGRAGFDYVAAIGGDTHNYQRYPVDIAASRLEYVVSGGGGAYMSDTHAIPNVNGLELPPGRRPLSEADTVLYPIRGDSLAYYSAELVRRSRQYLAYATSWLLVALALAWLLASGFHLPPWTGDSMSDRGWPLWGAAASVGIAGLFQALYGLLGVRERRGRVSAYGLGLLGLGVFVFLLDRPWRHDLPLWAPLLALALMLFLYAPQERRSGGRSWISLALAAPVAGLAVAAALVGWEVDPPLTIVLMLAPLVLPVVCIGLYGWRTRRFALFVAGLLVFVLVSWLVQGPTIVDEGIRWVTAVALFLGVVAALGFARARRSGAREAKPGHPKPKTSASASTVAWTVVGVLVLFAVLVGIFLWDVSSVLALVLVGVGLVAFIYMLSLGLVRMAVSTKLRGKTDDAQLLTSNASRYVGGRIDDDPVRQEARDLVELDRDLEWLFGKVFPERSLWPLSPFHAMIAEALDADTASLDPDARHAAPPLFKNYMTLEVRTREGKPELVLRAWGVSGSPVGAQTQVDDEVVISLERTPAAVRA